MKIKITVLQVILIVAAFSNFAFSQITMTDADFNFQFKAGNKVTISWNTSTSPVNIGNTGSDSWDFSNISTDLSYISDIVTPGSTPFRPDYPNAQTTFEYTYANDPDTSHDWEYYCRSTFYVHLHGLVYSSTATPGQVKKLIYNPLKIFAVFPFTFEKTWRDTVTETIKIVENEVEISTKDVTVVTHGQVDAYGPLTFPNGKTADALRVRVQETRTDSALNVESRLYFQWFTKTGETLTVEADPASVSTGMVSASSVKWIINNPSTAVATEKPTLPGKFKLDQNFPNPFNPATVITYSVPSESDVEVRVFNTIGKEVALLVNERKSPGVYTASFNGEGLTSGIYFAKMTAGNFSQVVKMILLK